MCPEVGQIEARVLNRECSSVWPIPNETSTAPVFVCGARSPCVEFIISFLIETEVLGPCCFCVFYSWLKECLKSLYRLSPYCVRCALREAVGFWPQLQSSVVALDSSLRLFQCPLLFHVALETALILRSCQTKDLGSPSIRALDRLFDPA